MKQLSLLLCMSALCISAYGQSHQPLKRGDQGGGGGDAYVADFISIAYKVYGWLEKNGQFLEPKVDASDFILTLEPKKIASQNEPLFYRGVEVDAYYKGEDGVIHINRPRYSSIQEESIKWRLVSHEIFRKMKLEDDEYQITQQIIYMAFALPDLSVIKPGNYIISKSDCQFHLEMDLPNHTLYFEAIESQPKREFKCETVGVVIAFKCLSSKPPQCKQMHSYYGSTMTILPDGNLIYESTYKQWPYLLKFHYIPDSQGEQQ